ncbi:MAG: hypothetical protein K8I30_10920, partial [Anaerolineae bacterium]|nr:hypothetical protein [Anaerolineae bacterium]
LWSDHKIGEFRFTPDYRAGQPADFQFSPDNLTLAATSNDGILLWNIGGEFDLEPDQLLPTEAGVYNLRYTPDGKFLIALEADGNIEIWDADSGERQRHITAGTNLYLLDISPDGRWLRGLTSAGNEAIVWDIHTGQEQVRLPRGAVLNSDWSYAAYWDAGTVHVRHMPTTQDTALSIIPDYLGAVSGFDAEAGQVIFSGHAEPFDLLTGLPAADPAPVLAKGGAILSPDGRLEASLDGSCGALNVSIHDAQTDELLVGLSIYDVCGLFTGVFSHDGQWLILGFD